MFRQNINFIEEILHNYHESYQLPTFDNSAGSCQGRQSCPWRVPVALAMGTPLSVHVLVVQPSGE